MSSRPAPTKPAPKTMTVQSPATQARQKPVAAPQPKANNLMSVPPEPAHMSPLEEARTDGSTQAVRPRVDPGM